MNRVPWGAWPTASTASAQNRPSFQLRGPRFASLVPRSRHTHLTTLVQEAKQLTVGKHRQDRVLQKSLAVLPPDLPQPLLRTMAGVVQLAGVLHAQNNRMAGTSLMRDPPVRLLDRRRFNGRIVQ